MMLRRARFLALLALLSACAAPPEPPPPAPAPAPRLSRVTVAPEEIRRYQKAVAARLPGTVRFRHLRVVEDRDGNRALCGQLEAGAGRSGRAGFQGFHAPLTISGAGLRAEPALARDHGLLYVFERCKTEPSRP
ncbi:hypothetical protein [Roseomonas sp. KE0001]|uniref:hypothetical protein n=1 Tax=Roseomonas sp. KE0001 TaxID=2479201 RepID=UPI0018E04CA9|nr:hypothetical protein [Roseomonas sp. KE0001]MBI0435029.1 hypothetical protein [Roseomonas sp. KE0001]